MYGHTLPYIISIVYIVQESLSSQLKEPDLLLSDLSKLDTPMQAHLAFLTLAQFLSLNGTLPKPRSIYTQEQNVLLRH